MNNEIDIVSENKNIDIYETAKKNIILIENTISKNNSFCYII